MYRYAQLAEKGKWIEVIDSPDIEQKLQQMGAVRATVLAVSDVVSEDGDNDNLKYKGPLYFDIDSPDLTQAIASTRELVHKLRELDVPDEAIKVFCSGKKGFHVFVPEKVFMETKRAVKGLPAIYMELAKELYVHGMDFQVYSGSKGRVFRPENGLRPDGAYRVRVSLNELETMTPSDYREVVKAPRDKAYPEVNGAKAYSLAALYERAKTTAHKKAVLRNSALPVEELKPYAEDPPACIPALVLTDKNVHFNQAGMQLAIFISRAGVPNYKASSLMDEMATRKTSSTYDTFRKRKVHLEGLVKYTQNKEKAEFSCAAMRTAVGRKVCRDCPLNGKTLGGRGMEDMPAVLARPDGYYIAGKEEDRRVSTFTLHPVEVFVDQAQNGGTARRTGTSMQVQSHGEILGTIHFDETGWRSRSELLRQMEGIGNLGFLGSDVDVQKLKIAVYQAIGDEEVDEITKVHSAGVWETATNIKGDKVYTYVEPGLSINSYGIKGTHELHGRVVPEPRLRMSQRPESGDQKMKTVLQQLIAVNSPVVMAQLLGWHSLCHIKAQVMSVYGQFPSLNLWGNAGSGKTMTSTLLACLNGVDYSKTGPLLLSMTTAYPLIEVASSTTTIPRIFEEFNRSKIKKYGMYEQCVEIIKAAWNNHPVARGRLQTSKANNQGRIGAEVTEMHITAPLVICSEQAPDEPALQQRMLQVELSNHTRAGRSENFYYAQRHKDLLLDFSRALTMTSLKTKESWVGEKLDEHYASVPHKINDRSRFAYALLFIGLDYFHAVAESLSIDITKEMNGLRTDLATYLKVAEPELVRTKVWSEVDQVLSILADMAQLAIQDQGLSPLLPGKHFLAVPSKDELILDLEVIYPLYRMFTSKTKTPMVFNSLKQLTPLLKSESYYVTNVRRHPEVSESRKVWVLRLSELADKGHNIGMFSE